MKNTRKVLIIILLYLLPAGVYQEKVKFLFKLLVNLACSN